MEKFYLVLLWSGHCQARSYIGYRVFSEEELKEYETRWNRWHQFCLENGKICKYCGSSDAEMWERYEIVDEISAPSKEEAEWKFVILYDL